MADITPIGGRPRIIAPGYRTEDLPEISMTRDEFVDAELGVLRGQVRQLQTILGAMRETVNIHHQALTLLQEQMADLEARTLRGRWRRFVAYLRALTTFVADEDAKARALRYGGRDLSPADRDHAIAMGWLPGTDPQP